MYERVRRFSFVAPEHRCPPIGTRKNPRQLGRRGFVKRIQIYRLTKNVAPFSSGLATFLATFSFSQQEDLSVQDVWSLVLQPESSEQAILELLPAFALRVVAGFFVGEDLASPACANCSEARPANVKQTMSFFIAIDLWLK
jgi:hypothetical protein